MRVVKGLFIAKNFILGGAEKDILNIADKLRQHDHRLDLAVFENKIDIKIKQSLTIHHLSSLQFHSPFSKTIGLLKGLIRLIPLIPQYHYLISFERSAGYISVLLSRIFKKKSIIRTTNPIRLCLASSYPNRIVYQFHLLLHRLMFSLTDWIICPSQGIKKEIVTDFSINPNKIIIIHPLINLGQIKQYSRRRLNQYEISRFKKKTIVINIGRLDNQKNQTVLINAFARVVVHHPQAILLIIGDGEKKTLLRQQIKQLHLNKRVFLLGKKNNPFPYLRRARLFVFTSKYEGYATVLIEALYCRIPIISIDCPYGPREILTKQTAHSLLVPDDDRVVINLSTQIIKQLSFSGKVLPSLDTQIQYHPKIIVRQWLNLIDHIHESQP